MQGVDHYENFPVATWLCPAALRPAVQAIYRFARTADDLADEGCATAEHRLADLKAYRQELQQACEAAAQQKTPGGPYRWPQVFPALSIQIRHHRLPPMLLHALLDAFEQDVRHTEAGHRYADLNELLDYCSRSANPVGRLLLHLYQVTDTDSLQQSDAICSALQLINFWQDLHGDLQRDRHYLPADHLQRYRVEPDTLLPGLPHPEAGRMVLALCRHARQLMNHGAPLAWRLPGRVGWELRLVVQGGLRILDKIEALKGETWIQRPRLVRSDIPLLLWRAFHLPRAPRAPALT